jgi:hypothetical protein
MLAAAATALVESDFILALEAAVVTPFDYFAPCLKEQPLMSKSLSAIL